MNMTNRLNLWVCTYILAFALIVTGAFPAAAQSTTLKEIRVQGAERIEPATVVSYMDLRVGDPMTRESLDRSLKSLFATGLFADIALRQEGGALVVDVVENPIINQIAFEGNDKIEDEELQSEIQLRPRQVFTRTKVQADVSRIYQLYRRTGRFSVNIDPKVIRLDQNRVNLVFEIDEGPVTEVESIRFVGNKRFDDDRLRSEISTKESAWYRFLTADDRYDPDRLSFDQELLRRFYLSQGYADFRILSAVAELSNDKRDFYVTFTLEEGQRYKVAKVGVDSRLRNFDPSVLNEFVGIESGDWYNADRVQETVVALTDALADRQYAFVNVRPDISRNREARTIDLSFVIDESPRVFVERVNVNGNMRTLDKVIRREMELVEGDPFNKTKLAESEQNIRNLDFFESVNMDVSPGSAPDKTVVDIDVAEKSTGELSVGAGFSTSDGPLADFRIRERNLLGKGQDLLLGATIAGERTEFDLSFTEPYFLDRDVSAGFDLFHITRDLQDESSFDQKRTGGAVRVGYPLSKRWRQTLRYSAERNEITDVQSGASRFVQDQEGQRDTSAIGQRLTYDSRDSTIFPTDGWYLWLDTEVAGLGGDAKYVSGRSGASYFYPVYDQWVLNILGEVGAIEGYSDTDVQINERFFLGGSTLRGFESSGIGPRDSTTRDALGGNYFYRGSAEMSFPLGLPEELGILGHAFSDFGTLTELDDSGPEVVDEDSIRASVGAGLSWRSPLGPVRVDLAVPVVKEDIDQEETFRFNFGTRF
ncbi:MAG: outer membrane protein assembly factor BamA [Alphaproteobacteria bacterium]|nr:outer membrane protein assembly factor BamA [Alphaproteobacteria bacterium]